jgi:hypothetical protein
LEYPESPSPDNDDYKPGNDDNEGDNEDDGDNEGINGNEGVCGHNLNESPTCVRSVNSHKHPRSDSLDSNNGKYEKARKIVRSSGRPKASNYMQEVQDVLNTGITYFEVDLLHFDLYPERVDELKWAKASWSMANTDCNLIIAHNTELIKMVSPLNTNIQVADSDNLHR